jgi:hypothetical protein
MAHLTVVLDEHLDELVKGFHPDPTYPACLDQNCNTVHYMLLQAFHQCIGLIPFEFDLRVSDMKNWMMLYGVAIRCSIAPCKRGFAMLGWNYLNVKKNNRLAGHATTLYIDTDTRKQVFIDPSLATKNTNAGNIPAYLATHHVWEHDALLPDKAPNVSVIRTVLFKRKCPVCGRLYRRSEERLAFTSVVFCTPREQSGCVSRIKWLLHDHGGAHCVGVSTVRLSGPTDDGRLSTMGHAGQAGGRVSGIVVELVYPPRT